MEAAISSDMDTAVGQRYAVPALERGLAILQLFNRQQRVLTAAEMARELRIPRTTVFRLVQTLLRLGFLERDHDNYRIGSAVLRLGFEYIASLEVAELARPIVDQLRDRTGFSAQLVTRDGRDVVVTLRAAGPSTFASNVHVGTRLPAHGTILGRVLLSGCDDAALKQLYPERSLPRVSDHAPRTLAELKQLLHEDRARGYATSEAFFEADISAVAAPVRDHSGQVVAALSVAVQRPTLEPKELRERLIAEVTAGAAQLSHRLNYRPAEAAA